MKIAPTKFWAFPNTGSGMKRLILRRLNSLKILLEKSPSQKTKSEYFGAFGKVESLELPFDTLRGERNHYIFVSFAIETAARKAISQKRREIFGHQCVVRVAVTREQANR